MKEREEIEEGKERLEYNRRRTMGIMIGFGPDGKNLRPWRLDQDEGHLVALLSFISPVETLPWTISRFFYQRRSTPRSMIESIL